MITPEKLYKELLQFLGRTVNHITIQTWFDDAKVLDITPDGVVLYSPSTYKQEYINTRFLPELELGVRTILEDENASITVLGGEMALDMYMDEQERQGLRNNDFYTFKHFVVGPSNQFAHAAAKAVANAPGKSYNPLFIYGPSGLGKTHLLYAIAGQIEHNFPKSRILYTKGEQFTNEIIEAIQQGPEATKALRSRYRTADLFLVDDVQYIAGKDRTQEEFFHTFNALHEAGKQIVLTADRPPKELSGIMERLQTRFEWGLIADIQPPDYETRMAIIREKAKLIDLEIPSIVEKYLAETITVNVRQLEGAVKKLSALHDLMGKELTIELAQQAVEDIYQENPGLKPTAEFIIGEVAEYFQISTDRLISLNRAKDTVFPRQVAMYLVKELTDLSYPEIGREFGRNHSTVIYSVEKIKADMASDTTIATVLNDLLNNIREQ